LFALKYTSAISSHACNVTHVTDNTFSLSKLTIHPLANTFIVNSLFAYTTSPLHCLTHHNVLQSIVITLEVFCRDMVFHLYPGVLASTYIVFVSVNNVIYTLGTHPPFTKSLNFMNVASSLSVIHIATFQDDTIQLLSNS